jgi:hypothetical protein
MSDSFDFAFEESDVPRRARFGWVLWLFLIPAIVGVGWLALWMLDSALSDVAEGVVKKQIEDNLPEGVIADVDVEISGPPFIYQYVTGVIENIPISARAVLSDVPKDTTEPVGHVDASFSISQQALDVLAEAPDADQALTLGDGVVTYDSTQTVLGFPIPYTLTATPTVAGNAVELVPEKASVDVGSLNIDVQPIIDLLLQQQPLSICVASRLPEAVTLTGLTVTPDKATVTASADDVVLSGSSLRTPGSCG